ncbi:MAG TPA: sugar phosphate nucleotidyltransferase [Thermoanaerobaculia bacterium]|nr:sugar phosphate nucleotidyltransferase [Thermoanaerobaculia bacterium]
MGAARPADVTVAVLCGGLGTRLGELTRDVPKPMIAIGGRPYLERVLESFAGRGLVDFVLLTGYKHEVIETHFGDGASRGLRIAYSRENEPLGTGGALREARPLLGDRFLLTFGDVYRRFDYDRFVQQHIGNCLAVYPRIAGTAGSADWLSPSARLSPEAGLIARDDTVGVIRGGNTDVIDGVVVRFSKRAPELPYVDAGFAVMQTSTIDLLPESGPCSFEEIVYANLAEHGGLEGEIVDHEFCDIGTPEELARTRVRLESMEEI